MSIKYMSRVWDIDCKTHTEKLVLLALSDNANDQGKCWPSLKHLAKKCCLSERGVILQIQKLESIGWLKMDKEHRKANIYHLFPSWVNAVDPNSILGVTACTQEEGLGVTACTQEEGLGCTPCSFRVNAVHSNHHRTVSTKGSTYGDAPVTLCNAPVTHANASNANQNQNQNQNQRQNNTEESKRFAPPTLEMVKLQCSKTGLPDSEAGAFLDYYTSNGWRVGRNPMRSWQAAVGNWKRHWEEKHHNANGGYARSSSASIRRMEALTRATLRDVEAIQNRPK